MRERGGLESGSKEGGRGERRRVGERGEEDGREKGIVWEREGRIGERGEGRGGCERGVVCVGPCKWVLTVS